MSNTMMKTGLVLEGGAMRGMFTAGVMDVLMENGIRFDGAIGVSAGACNGLSYCPVSAGVPSTAISTCWKNTITSD